MPFCCTKLWNQHFFKSYYKMRARVREGDIKTPMEEVKTLPQLHRLELTNL